MENRGPQIANGSMRSSPATEVTGLTPVPNESQQPFPSLPEGWINYETSSRCHINHDEDISPTRTIAPPWRTPPRTNGLPSLETSNAPRTEPQQEIKSATVPQLSPVFETNMSPPTASRSSDLSKLANGSNAHAKENGQQHRRLSHGAQNNSNKDNRNSQQKGNQQSNGQKPNNGGNASAWQQQPPSRKKKSKKTKGPEPKTTGEVMPANASERKGG